MGIVFLIIWWVYTNSKYLSTTRVVDTEVYVFNTLMIIQWALTLNSDYIFLKNNIQYNCKKSKTTSYNY